MREIIDELDQTWVGSVAYVVALAPSAVLFCLLWLHPAAGAWIKGED